MRRAIMFGTLLLQLNVLDGREETAFSEANTVYPVNLHVDAVIWNFMKPYFLPGDHPVKKKVDKLFAKNRVTASALALKKAKFSNTKPGKWSHCIVTKNKKIKGYWFKLFTDDKPYSDWDQLLRRVQGAHYVKKMIDANNWSKWFAVPRKWIYPLPQEPAPPEGSHRKNFVLIAEDMKLLSKSKNKKQWKSRKALSSEKMQALYTILETLGLNDSVYAFNLPFTKKGKIAFIDLEHYHNWPVPYYKLNQFLHPAVAGPWAQITKQ